MWLAVSNSVKLLHPNKYDSHYVGAAAESNLTFRGFIWLNFRLTAAFYIEVRLVSDLLSSLSKRKGVELQVLSTHVCAHDVFLPLLSFLFFSTYKTNL